MKTQHQIVSSVTEEELVGLGGYLRCESCGFTRTLGDVSAHLTYGWPKCCGYTMMWWTQRQIDAGEVTELGCR